MTTTQTQIRRDTATNLAAATPAAGEPFYDTTNKRLGAGDGSTAGGIPHASFADIQKQNFVYATVGGTANAITLTPSPALAAYGAGARFQFKATGTNTGATTVNVSGLGTKNIYKLLDGALTALEAGDIISGGIYEIIYDGTQFQIKGLPMTTPETLPAAVTGTLSGHPVAFTVDFTTYSSYMLSIVDALAGASTLTIEVSTNSGGAYTSVGSSGFGTISGGTPFYRNYIVAQPSASGPIHVLTGPTTGEKAAVSAAVDRVRIGNANAISFSAGTVILQPLSKR